MPFLNHIKKTFSFDYRSLALYRVLIGLVVMADVLYRWPDLANFYTDAGLVPRSIFMSEMTMPWSFSLHMANGSYGFAVLMFSIHLIFGLMLVFGYKSRWAIVGAFVMTASVHNRNWLVNNGGDDILRAILFISIFLPLNRRFSIDSALAPKEDSEKNDHFSTWGLTFFLQVFCIYFVSYILKDHPMWRSEFTATFYSLRLDIFANTLSVWLRDHFGLMKAITIFTIYVEWAGPLLLIFSFFFGRHWWKVRAMTVLLFWGLHIGIILTMLIGVFPYICLAMWTIFIPEPFWDWLALKFKRQDFHKLVIYYDLDCNFCKKGVLIIREFFLLSDVSVLPAQDFPEIHQQMLKQNSWVVVNEKGERLYHFAAAVEVFRHSPILKYTVPFFSSRPVFALGTKIYLWISTHRSVMGLTTQFLSFSTKKKKIGWLTWPYQISGAFLFVTLFMWNLTTIRTFRVSAPFFQGVTRWLHLYQEWNMFAPFPKTDNIWVEIPAILEDGTELELLSGDRDIYSVKDQNFYGNIRNEHWRKFYLNLSDSATYARYYGGYLCREWNERNIRKVPDQTLRKFEIIIYSQQNLPDGSKGGITRKLSWKHWCYDEDYKKDQEKMKP